jgi:hypothetical protein
VLEVKINVRPERVDILSVGLSWMLLEHSDLTLTIGGLDTNRSIDRKCWISLVIPRWDFESCLDGFTPPLL